ncbi:hypothetical protein [Mucilaginibacter aquatilis]|uniref:hypothetical protein n=1 Tax=Mucilaginibacter aquatilis TaxID=1517760 RepID=UPI0018DEBDC7|nr:hypothetical protein [Mucilaginibacter aquatilis]
MSAWTTLYDGHKITVENSWFGGERLWVNGTLQDEQLGFALRSRLYGSLKAPGQETKRIKVSLGTQPFQWNARFL